MLPLSLNALVAWTLYLSLTRTAHATPTIVYGLMAQEPPVARVGSPFLFDLFPGSFNSTSTISYSAAGLPAWLTWSETALSFAGTPAASDVGERVITLTAADATGSVSSNFTLITTTYTVPGVHQSFTTQIGDPSSRVFSSVQPMPGDTGVTVPPYWSFSLGFAWDTFRLSKTEPTNGNLFFMAHERGTVGLPSWLEFNNETMTFNGLAPSNGSFTIVATGTDFWGYTGAQSSFVIQIGEGYPIEMVKGGNFSSLNAIAREQVDYTVSLADVLYNGTQATDSQVVLSIDDPDFSWLSLEGTKLTGQVPDSYINGSDAALFIPLTIASRNTSSTLSLLTWIPFDVTPYLFNAFTLPAVNTKASQEVLVNVSPYVANKAATVNATVSPSDAASWLVYHTDNATLVGTVPKSPQYDSVNVTFTATQGNQTGTTDLQINIAGAPSNNGGGSASVPAKHDGKGLTTGAKVGIAVGAVVGALLLLLLLLWCCCYRRRKNEVQDEKMVDDDASFVAQSPPLDPFRRSQGLQAPKHLNLLGEIARFSGLSIRNPTEPNRRSQDQPHRMGPLNGGVFTLADEKEANTLALETPRLTHSSSSFLGHGDVIGIVEPEDSRPSQDASSFTQSFDSESDRASWESPDSFQWSSGENGDVNGMPRRHRDSATPSIPRPRADFTPRYPRNNSPTVLAQLASQHSLGMTQQESSSGSGSGSGHEDSLTGTFSGAGSVINSDFPSGPSGLNRFGSGFRSIDEEDENYSAEEAAVVSMAERQSFETRQPTRPVPKLRPSKERVASPNDTFGERSPQSRQALVERRGMEEGMYDDAEEYRRSMVGREEVGLGYPSSAIFGGSEYDDENGNPRSSTITAIPPHENPLSPPLPQVGSFVRQLHSPPDIRTAGANDGRVVACANETFSVHPQINPPPTVSLSAATWSSAPPSTYRAEVEGGGQLPAWLHFDARELELWGVPSMTLSGDVTVVRIIEKLPRDKRRSDPMTFGYEPQQEREVGRITIEVVDRIKSPQFSLEHSPHAM